LSLTKPLLGSDFFRGTLSYSLENVNLKIAPGKFVSTTNLPPFVVGTNAYTNYTSGNISTNIYNERGSKLISKIGTSIAYDTRNNVFLPDRGQRSVLDLEVAGPFPGGQNFYKIEARTGWYFKGFREGHVLELAARGGVAQTFDGTDQIPIYDRYFLGGLYTLRGFGFREVGPRDQFKEPLGGNTFFFGTAEYSVPIIERLRFAVFYDIGNVFENAYSFDANPSNQRSVGVRKFYNDNWGVGLRINIPHLGPLRLDYGIPITHDKDNGGSGKFQFGVGFQRPF
jgi:outer membrane protein insertion porin family